MRTHHSNNDTHVVVIGAGVIGLTTATLLQESLPAGTSIIIVAAELPIDSLAKNVKIETTSDATPSVDYASMWAGAHHRPIPYLTTDNKDYNELSGPQQQMQSQLASEHQMTLRTAHRMLSLARSDPQSGIKVVPAAEFLENPPSENIGMKTGYIYASPDDRFRILSQAELNTLNAKQERSPQIGLVKWACEYETYIVNPHVYCQYLLRQFQDHGGKVIRKRLQKLSDALHVIADAKPSIIVNCSGIGKFDFPDQKTKIIRGQTVLVRNEFDKTLTRQCADGSWSFLIPRPLGAGTIVGGTKQIDDPEASPRLKERQKLLEDAVRYFPEFVDSVEKFEVIQDNVGRRPWREGGMRIEIDNDVLADRATVIHGYGAGGRGYEISWGAAEKICGLVGRCLPKSSTAAKL